MPELAGAKDVGVVYEGGIVHDVELHDWWRIDRLFLYDESAIRASSPAGRSSLRTLFPSFDDNTGLLWLLTDPELIRVTGMIVSHRHESLAVCWVMVLSWSRKHFGGARVVFHRLVDARIVIRRLVDTTGVFQGPVDARLVFYRLVVARLVFHRLVDAGIVLHRLVDVGIVFNTLAVAVVVVEAVKSEVGVL